MIENNGSFEKHPKSLRGLTGRLYRVFRETGPRGLFLERPGESQMLQNQTKWRPGVDFFVSRSYQRRPFLADMADCEVIERFRLSRARIEWLVEELKEELQRNTARSCPLSPKTKVNIIVSCFIFYSSKAFAWKRYITVEFYFIVFLNQQTAGRKINE